MQLLLTLDELRVVARALEKCLAHSHDDAPTAKQATLESLLARVMDRDLRLSADELEDLSEILRACKVDLKSRIEKETNVEAQELLRRQQRDLEHAADKIIEACAMA